MSDKSRPEKRPDANLPPQQGGNEFKFREYPCDAGGQQPRSGNEFEGLGRDLPRLSPVDSGGGGGSGGNNPALGWLVFFLIFGVGNVILYSTTGIFIFPIPRR
jgi:hypothetical protein